jgi:hypothetical protein
MSKKKKTIEVETSFKRVKEGVLGAMSATKPPTLPISL